MSNETRGGDTVQVEADQLWERDGRIMKILGTADGEGRFVDYCWLDSGNQECAGKLWIARHCHLVDPQNGWDEPGVLPVVPRKKEKTWIEKFYQERLAANSEQNPPERLNPRRPDGVPHDHLRLTCGDTQGEFNQKMEALKQNVLEALHRLDGDLARAAGPVVYPEWVSVKDELVRFVASLERRKGGERGSKLWRPEQEGS